MSKPQVASPPPVLPVMGYLAVHFGSLLAASLLLYLSTAAFTSATLLRTSRSRRQIFREQVLPSSGGKIPEDAFRSDRLALNRLNKEGIAIPDGVVLEARHREAHFPSHRHDPDIDAAIIKLVLRPDGRYAPPEGRYPFNNLVDSTYVIRPPINVHGYGGIQPRKPIISNLRLPAKPFFASDSDEDKSLNNIESLDFLNTISQDFPGTRLWTGFGPLFHETSDRILRHSGRKNLNSKQDNRPPGNHPLGRSDSENKLKHQEQISSAAGPRLTQLQAQAVSSTVQSFTKGALPITTNQPTVRSSSVRTLEVVNGVLHPMSTAGSDRRPQVQPLRPGPGTLVTHLTAPQPGYPALDRIPSTSFRCLQSGARTMKADPQTNCQVFHLCLPDGKKESFLCPIGSRYNAKTNFCSLWTTVPCPSTT